jgi:RNA polymerase sigma-70 factor (ECF subfamily)
MSHDGRTPADPPSPRELGPAPGVEPTEDWMGGLVSDATPATAAMAGPDFDAIIAQHGRRLYHLAYRLTSDRAAAEDLSQETLMRGYRAIRDFRGEADFYTYLYRILLNLWKNQLRARRRWKMVPLGGGTRGEERETADREPADPAAGPHERLVGREQGETLRRALSDLDPDFRVVLVLRVAEGLEYEEIAAALGLPIGTVRSRLARARSRIRELMQRRGAAGR